MALPEKKSKPDELDNIPVVTEFEEQPEEDLPVVTQFEKPPSGRESVMRFYEEAQKRALKEILGNPEEFPPPEEIPLGEIVSAAESTRLELNPDEIRAIKVLEAVSDESGALGEKLTEEDLDNYYNLDGKDIRLTEAAKTFAAMLKRLDLEADVAARNQANLKMSKLSSKSISGQKYYELTQKLLREADSEIKRKYTEEIAKFPVELAKRIMRLSQARADRQTAALGTQPETVLR